MKFTESHEWVDVKDDIGVIGVTYFAQKELGDIVYVELPEVGKIVKAGDEAAVLESTKAAADVYSPVSGTILEVNQALRESSELINSSPEREGWIFKVRLSNMKEIDALMDQTSYQSLIK